MILAAAASDFFLHFGVGMLCGLALVDEPELKRSFYSFSAMLSAVCVALAAWLGGWIPVNASSPGMYLWLVLPFLLAFYALYGMGWRRAARASLLLAVGLGLLAVLGVLRATTQESMLPAGASAVLLFNRLTSVFLSGTVLSTLILGHWYLLSPRLSFKPLIRGAMYFSAAVCLRAVAILAILWVWGFSAGMQGSIFLERMLGWDHLGFFFLLRIFWGIIGPLVLSYMIYKTAAIQSNQSATGILYVALVFVLIGELICHYLWALAGIPL